MPFFVATKLSKIRRATLDKPGPERYVSAALNTVGLQTQTNGYLPHAIMVSFRGSNWRKEQVACLDLSSFTVFVLSQIDVDSLVSCFVLFFGGGKDLDFSHIHNSFFSGKKTAAKSRGINPDMSFF